MRTIDIFRPRFFLTRLIKGNVSPKLIIQKEYLLRLISILSAVLVTATLYLFVFERTALIAFAKTGDVQALVAVAYPADTTNNSAEKAP